MSKSDHTRPLWVIEKSGEHQRECPGGYPCPHMSMSGTLRVIKREMRRSERTTVLDAINRGEDPPVDQHKHRGLWDLV